MRASDIKAKIKEFVFLPRARKEQWVSCLKNGPDKEVYYFLSRLEELDRNYRNYLEKVYQKLSQINVYRKSRK